MGTACSTAASAVAEPAEKGHHHQRLCMPAPAEGTAAAATGWRYRRRRRRGRRACVPPRQLRADRRPRSGRGTDGREPEGKGEGGAMALDPDGREGEDRVQWKKKRRSAEDKVAWAPRTWVEKKSTAGGGMLRSPADSALPNQPLYHLGGNAPIFQMLRYLFMEHGIFLWTVLRGICK